MTSRTLVELTGELLGVPSRVQGAGEMGLGAGPEDGVPFPGPSASTATVSLVSRRDVMEDSRRMGGSGLSNHSVHASASLAAP